MRQQHGRVAARSDRVLHDEVVLFGNVIRQPVAGESALAGVVRRDQLLPA